MQVFWIDKFLSTLILRKTDFWRPVIEGFVLNFNPYCLIFAIIKNENDYTPINLYLQEN